MKISSLNDMPWESSSHNGEIVKKVAVRNGDIPPVTQLARITFKPGLVAQAHTHQDMTEAFLVEQGTGRIRVNDQTFSLLPASFLIVEPGEEHEVENIGQEDLVLTVLSIKMQNAKKL